MNPLTLDIVYDGRRIATIALDPDELEKLSGSARHGNPSYPARLSIERAAKVVGKSRRYLRKLVDDGKVRNVWKVGGSDEHPWLEVDVVELQRVIDEESVYVPPALAAEAETVRKQRHSMPAMSVMGRPLNPAAARMG